MPEQNVRIQIIGTHEPISFEQFGRESAANSSANPVTLIASLSTVYDKFLEEEKLDAEGIKQKINKLATEVLQKKSIKENSISTKISLEQEKEAKQKSIEEFELEKIRLKEEGAPQGDIVSFVIGVFIVILLTLFLFVFYSSAVYSAIWGIKNESILNFNVFSDAQAKGGGDLAFIILAPVFFLAIGFLLHDFLDKKNYGFIGALLTLTFSVDATLGYKISQNLHNNELARGLTNEQWKPSIVFSDVNFYLVLIFGFVAYVIWGALLHYTLNKYKELQPDKVLELKLNNLDAKIEERKSAITEIINKINNLNSQIAIIEHELEQLQKDIIGYQNGVIPINLAKLQSLVGQFMNGWFAFIDFMFKADALKAKLLTDESVEIQKKWLDDKIISLKTDL